MYEMAHGRVFHPSWYYLVRQCLWYPMQPWSLAIRDFERMHVYLRGGVFSHQLEQQDQPPANSIQFSWPNETGDVDMQ